MSKITINLSEWKEELLSQFLKIMQSPALIDEAVLAAGSIQSKKLMQFLTREPGGRSQQYLSLSALESINYFNNEANYSLKYVIEQLGIEVDRKRVKPQVMQATKQENISLKAQLILSAAIQHTSTLFTERDDCLRLNALLATLDHCENPDTFKKIATFARQTAAVDSLLLPLNIEIDDDGKLSAKSINAIDAAIEQYKKDTEKQQDSNYLSFNTTGLTLPEIRQFPESLRVRADFIKQIFPILANNKADLSASINFLQTRETACKKLALQIQHAISALAKNDNWQASYPFFGNALDTGTQKLNLPYSIHLQYQWILKAGNRQCTYNEALLQMQNISTSYSSSWFRYIRSFVTKDSPIIKHWHQQINSLDLSSLVNCQTIKSVAWECVGNKLKNFSEDLLSGKIEAPTALPEEEAKAEPKPTPIISTSMWSWFSQQKASPSEPEAEPESEPQDLKAKTTQCNAPK